MTSLLASLLLLIQALPPLLGPLIPETGGRVVGIVRRSDSGQPISGAQVAIVPAGASVDSAVTQAVVADSSGRFIMKGVGPGIYTIIAQADGYFSFLNDPALATRAKKDVVVAEGLQVEVGTIELLPAAAISGRVSAPDGNAVRGASVQAWRSAYVRGRLTFNLVKTVSTDDLGEYRLFWLLPGEYYVSAQYHGSGSERYSRVFFPGAVDEDGAPPILVGGGRELSGIDLQVPITPVTGVKVSGRLIIEGEVPAGLRIASVAVVPRERRISFVAEDAYLFPNEIVDASGRFEVRNVPAGEYDVFPVIRDADKVVRLAHAPVSVTDSDTEGVAVVLDPQMEMTGRITLDGAAPGDRLKDSVVFTLLDGLPGKLTETGVNPKPDTGEFAVPHFSPGRYMPRLDARARAAGIYVADMKYGGANTPNSEFVVEKTASPLTIDLKSDGGTVSGTVLDITRLRAFPYATVVLLPDRSRRSDYTLHRDATCDVEGKFSFAGVPPGDYVLFAWQTVTPGAWQNPIFLGRYENRGVAVTVEAASTKTMQIVAIP